MIYKKTRAARKTLNLILGLCMAFTMANSSEAECQRKPGELGEHILKKRKDWLNVRFPVALIKASDSQRSESMDIAGKLLLDAGFTIASKEVVKNLDVKDAIERAMNDPATGAIIVIGGTGFSSHDVTPEAIKSLISQEIPGFGELLRMMTYFKFKEKISEIGVLAFDTRATAGIIHGKTGKKIVVAVPGSPEATELAVINLLIPGLPIVYMQLHKKC